MNSNASVSAASVYRFKDRWIVSPDKRTTAGLVVSSEPFIALPLDVNNDDLGSILMKALALSKSPMPHPVDWKSMAAPRLAAAGVKSERTSQLNAALVQVTWDDQYLTFTPTRNSGAVGESKGFHALSDVAVKTLIGSDATVGEVLRRAFSKCS